MDNIQLSSLYVDSIVLRASAANMTLLTPSPSSNPYYLILEGLAAQVGNIITQTEYEAVQIDSCKADDALEIALAMGVASRNQHDTFHKIVSGFERFVEPLNRFSGAFDSMAQASQIAAIVWGSIKMMLVVRSRLLLDTRLPLGPNALTRSHVIFMKISS